MLFSHVLVSRVELDLLTGLGSVCQDSLRKTLYFYSGLARVYERLFIRNPPLECLELEEGIFFNNRFERIRL